MRKLITSLFILIFTFIGTGPVFAISDSADIANLPEYTSTDNFEVSFSALSDNEPTVKFYYKKDGESYAQFGPTYTDRYSGTVQITGTQIAEQAKYYFKVEVSEGGETKSDETSTTYDISGPSPVQNYRKEMIGGGHYRLFWKNPGDSDFSRVFIYRSTSTEFTADGSTKIAERGGSPDDDMIFDDVGLDTNKTYYYALRAVDKAGNASSIVADPEVIQTTTTTEEGEVDGGTQTAGEVVILPQEEGQVLGETGDKEVQEVEEMEVMESPSPSPEGIADAYNQAKLTLFNTTKGKLALFGALVLGFISYFIWRRRS